MDLRIPDNQTPHREQPSVVLFVKLLKSEHALCHGRPDAPSSLHYDDPSLPDITLRCLGCGGSWTRRVTGEDLVQIMLANNSTSESTT